MMTPDWIWGGATPRSLRRRCAIWATAAVTLFAACSGALEARPMRKHRHHAAIHSQPDVYPRTAPFPQTALPLWRQPCFSLDDCDRKAFDESGTRGRMGLGADPAHPEGPGNFSD
jgi:hypothetical protein